MKIVVTGGAGFIGANLCRELAGRGSVDEVVALDDLSTGFAGNLDGAAVRLVVGSILDPVLLAEVVRGADAVVHLAARPSVPLSLRDPVASHEANVTGTLYVLEAARRVGAHLVAASSSAVYGPVAQFPTHEDLPARPSSPYGVGKLATEAYLSAYTASFGLPTLALRFFNVYGPLQGADHPYAAVVPAFVDAALRGEPVVVHGDGRQTRDFIYVGPVVRVLADAVQRRVCAPGPVNLAFGTRVSIVDLVARLAEVLGRPVTVRHEPARPGDLRDSQADGARLRALFGEVQPIGLRAGLAQTVAWHRSLQLA